MVLLLEVRCFDGSLWVLLCLVLAVQLEEGVGQGQLDSAVPHQKSNHVIDGKAAEVEGGGDCDYD